MSYYIYLNYRGLTEKQKYEISDYKGKCANI